MREFLAWDACTPEVGADDDALPDFPTDDFTPPPTSALWLKDICVNTANFIESICSIRCETPATGAPVASSPLGGDAVGDRDPNDDPSTDAAAARGVTVVATAVALFYAL